VIVEWIAYCMDCKTELDRSRSKVYIHSEAYEHKMKFYHNVIVGYRV